jgi:hypothetical protein
MNFAQTSTATTSRAPGCWSTTPRASTVFALRLENPLSATPWAGHWVEIYYETERFAPAGDQVPGFKNLPQRYSPQGIAPRRLDHARRICGDKEIKFAEAFQRVTPTVLQGF